MARRLRLLLAGMLNPDQSVGAVLRACERVGVDVVHVALRRLVDRVGVELAAEDLAAVAKELEADAVLIYNSRAGSLAPGLCERLRRARPGLRVFWYCFDDPMRSSTTKPDEEQLRADVVLTCDAGSLDVYRRIGARRVLWHPPALDPSAQGLAAPARRFDVGFAVHSLYRTTRYTRFRTDRAALISAMRGARDLACAVWGPAKRIEEPAGELWQGFVRWEDWGPVAQACRCHVNPYADTRGRLYLNERVIQVCGGGSLMVCDVEDTLRDLLEPGAEALYFSSVDEALERVRWAKAHPAEAERIAAAGRRRLSSWTYDAWVEQIERVARGEAPARVLGFDPETGRA